MDKAGDRALVVGLHGHHKAVGAHGDDGLLQGLGVGGRGDDLLQSVPGPGGRRPHLAADGGQLVGGPVGDLVLAHDGGVDLLLQKFIGVQGVKQVVDGGLAHGVVGDIAPDQPGALQDPCDVQQLPGVQRAPQIGPGQRGAHVLYAGEGGAAPDHHHGLGGGGLVQTALDLRPVAGGRQAEGLFLCRLPHRLLGEHLQHRRQLQSCQ